MSFKEKHCLGMTFISHILLISSC